MAWQSSAAMVGNGGGPGGGEGSSQGSQPQGTEYTLQGVMRFLQTEWHRHERDRNAWEIERAEMKSRISKLEGEGRTSKRMQESLGKHIKLLEIALRKEREKVRKLQAGQEVDDQKLDAREVKDFARSEYAAPASKGSNAVDSIDVASERSSFVELKGKVGIGNILHSELKQEAEREKSRLYLQKCLQEFTYHTLPTQLAAEEQEQLMHDQQYENQMSQQSLNDAYMQHQRMRQQGNHIVPAPPMSNNQTTAVPRTVEQHVILNQPRLSGRGPNIPGNTGFNDSVESSRRTLEDPTTSDEPVVSVSHIYNEYGQPVAYREEQNMGGSGQAAEIHEPNESSDWIFEGPEKHTEELPDYTADHRPDKEKFPPVEEPGLKESPQGSNGHRRKSSLSRRRASDDSTEGKELSLNQTAGISKGESTFRVRFALRGHVDVIRSVIFTGGGSPSEPEICTTGDDGVIKRWTIPASYGSFGSHGSNSSGSDLDVSSYFTHRGHTGPVMCLAAAPASPNISNGGRAQGDGWVFSGGQDKTIRVWERGRVDPKATLSGHTDAIWSICVLPGTSGSILGDQCSRYGGPDRIIIISGAADGTICVWAVSSPPQLTSPPATGSRRGGRRANSVSSGSQFPSSPQASTATTTPFHHSLVHKIERSKDVAPTCIVPLSPTGLNFVVSCSDSSVVVFDSRTGEEIVGMASQETYDGTSDTAVNAVVATSLGAPSSPGPERREEEEIRGATSSSSGVERIVLSGHEDKYIRFFDANSGQCTYSMIAHQSAISAMSLSPNSLELVSAGHDASLRFWSLEKRTCVQEITSHRPMRGEGVCAVVWSADGRWVVSGGGDGVVKVFSR